MSGAAQRFVDQVVGGNFTVRESDLTLTTAQQEILRNDPERVGYLIVVTGATTAQLGFSTDVATATSILIAGVGGSFSVNVRDDFMLPAFALHGNVAAGTTTIHIVEIIRVSLPAA